MIGQGQETVVEQTWGRGEFAENACEEQNGREVLVLARRGPLRTSLQSLLLAAPWLEKVSLAQEVLPALQIITQHEPALVIVLDALPGAVEAVLRRTGRQESRCRSLVLVRNNEQRKEALDLGADMALLRGFPAAKLYRIIEQLVLDLEGSRTQGLGGG